jgi:DNA-binding XRE family transcriptional regulator
MVNLSGIQKKFIEFAIDTFPEYQKIIETWKRDLLLLKEDEAEYHPSQSLKAFLVIIQKIASEESLHLQNLWNWIPNYKNEIRDFVLPYLDMELNQTPKNSNQDVIKELLNQSFVESGSALLFHKLRDTISKNEFELTTDFPTAHIVERTIRATAQVRESNTSSPLSSHEIEQWQKFTAQAITSMDDLTADIFDIISILWMKKATHKDEMIQFHTDDALNLRQVQGRNELDGYQTGYRKKERDEIMKRLAALTTIWIKIERDKLRFVDVENNELDELDQVQYNPLFLLDSVTVAYRGDQPVGIYECRIKPGELLANFLFGSKRSSGLLALKTLQYHPIRQKYHKRLARYLSWQWRIRQKGADYLRPYSIGGEKGLLNVMGIEENSRYGSRTKDQFEGILDTLQQDGIIRDWNYLEEDFQESFVEEYKEWFDSFFLKARVRITPPNDIVEQSKDKDILGMQDHELSQQLNFSELLKDIAETEVAVTVTDIQEVTPDNMKRVRLKRKKNISEAAKEIGISHSTLSRYEHGKIQTPSQDNAAKMSKWLNG